MYDVLKLRHANGMSIAVTALAISAAIGAILLAGLGLFPVSSWAASATLTWDPPTTNADGTPLTDLAGYKIYHGTSPGAYGPGRDVGNVTTSTLTGLSEGPNYFAVTAYDTSGNESAHSNEVPRPIVIPPSAPTLRSSIIIIITP